jgi:hypothetical protein
MSKTAEFITESKAMYKKGYRYFITIVDKKVTDTFYFKLASEVGPFLRTEYPKAKMLKTGPIHG